MKKKQKFAFLYLKTGGGHLAPASAIARYMGKKYSGRADVALINGLENATEFARLGLEESYRQTQSWAVWFFELSYAINKIIPIARFSRWFATIFIEYGIRKSLLKEMPDKIVVFHFFLIKAVLNIVKKDKLNVPVLVFVTDPYTAPPFWFLSGNRCEYLVLSEDVKNYGVNSGIDPDKIHVFPFVLDEKFTVKINKSRISSLKKKYGYRPGKKLVLIMGGGDGIPRGTRILRGLIKSGIDADIAIVCGKNRSLFKRALMYQKIYRLANLKIYEFIDFVYELVNMSDVVITKCGASTIMEILFAGRIPVISDYIWEQEKGNYLFVEKNGLGVYEPSINKLPSAVCRLIYSDKLRARYQKNIEKAKLRNGAGEVSDFLINY